MTRWLDELHARVAAEPALAAVVTALAAGDLARARAAAEARVAGHPDDPDGWYLLALACAEAGALGASLAACDRCVALAPDFPDAHFGRGWAFEGMQRHDLAAAAYGDALARDPHFTQAWINLTGACLQVGDLGSALAVSDAALAAGVDDAHLRLHRAELRIRLEEPDLALAELARARELDPRAVDALAEHPHLAPLADRVG